MFPIFMNTRTSPRTNLLGFTLIELLTVMALIAILMAMLFPLIGKSIILANKSAAKNTANNIVNAVLAYQTEYSKLPSISSATPANPSDPNADTIVGDSSLLPNANIQADNSALFNTLRGINFETNPRKVSYFSDRTVSNPDLPKSGFLDNPKSGPLGAQKGCLFDPWGSEYFVVMDTNYDGQINVAGVYQDFAFPEAAPRVTVGAFSLGPDRLPGSPEQGLPPNTYQSGKNTSDAVLSWR
jgi:prepilin-type N-terminal cleavage/methylation domain-containing protein